ncbi:MBL fold metallo-hydrolase [Proteobacteria bacterium 005FR1]|nr:MBL fold metallo-hydrolase [Proteobacteria bacterium 005FR1]
MDFTFLGTSSGVPTRKRNVSALALRGPEEKSWYLIDCGEGTQHQLLRTPFSLHRLAAVFITHMHGDHCFGLPGLLASAGMGNRSEPLTLVGPAPLEEFVRKSLALSDSYLPFPLSFLPVETLKQWSGGNVSVEAWPLSHRVPSYAYSFTETNIERKLNRDKLITAGIPPGPAWGKLLAGEPAYRSDGSPIREQDFFLPPRKPRRSVIGGDNDDPGLLAQACDGAHLLIHESTFTEAVAQKLGPSRQHSHAAGVARFAERVGVPNLILTHFSPRYQQTGSDGNPGIVELELEARKHYSGNLQLAEDFASYSLTKSGDFSRAS